MRLWSRRDVVGCRRRTLSKLPNREVASMRVQYRILLFLRCRDRKKVSSSMYGGPEYGLLIWDLYGSTVRSLINVTSTS